MPAEYACKACDVITQARLRRLPTPRGRATPATLAHLLMSKYCDHLPLYRPERDLCSRWRRSRPLHSMRLGRPSGLVVAADRRRDQTACLAAEKNSWRRYDGPSAVAGARPDQDRALWVYVRDDRPFCGTAPPPRFTSTVPIGWRAPAAHMAGFTGFLQADGYAGSRRSTSRAELVRV